jgi:serine/threonine protein kinase
MPLKIQAGAEPIPGYKLLSRLGSGSFGEVWKAQAPGGLHKAIKFVFGNLHTTDRDTVLANQELDALKHLQAIRHPFILSLERYDVVDGQLTIVMELADRSLWDRLKECKKQGLSGIPREELLGYLEEAAEALDLMNLQHGLLHLDIKPANLFLIHQHVKVADFGLVKDLKRLKEGDVGGTPAYAPPEVFRGRASRQSDQYSLAIVYQELLTGQRPFDGTDQQLRARHLAAPPNLVPLPTSDRAAVGRALAKKPEDRFASCMDFIQALDGEPATNGTNGKTDSQLIMSTTMSGSRPVVEAACPKCGFKGRAPAECQGRKVHCRNCSTRFRVPGVRPAPALEIPDDIGLSPVEEEVVATVVEVAAVVDANCPQCGYKGRVPEKFVGRKLKCRKCTALFIVGGQPRTGIKRALPTMHGQPKPSSE